MVTISPLFSLIHKAGFLMLLLILQMYLHVFKDNLLHLQKLNPSVILKVVICSFLHLHVTKGESMDIL